MPILFYKVMQIAFSLLVLVQYMLFKVNEQTDRWHTLTHMTLDLDQCDLWPWSNRPLTSTLPVSLSNEAPNNVFLPSDLDLWPMTLTFRVYLGVTHVHDLTTFHKPRFNGFWDMNFDLVTDIHTDIQKVMHMSPPCIRTGGLKNDCSIKKDNNYMQPRDYLHKPLITDTRAHGKLW